MLTRRHEFTLLEVAAVIAILMVVSAVAASYLRTDRKVAQMERALRDFQLFCARARAEAMRSGEPCRVVFYPDEKEFRIEKISDPLESGSTCKASEVDSGELAYVVLDVLEEADYPEDEATSARNAGWRFPEKLEIEFRMEQLNELFTGEGMELWRFGRDGAARLHRPLVVESGGLVRSVTISEFSGLLETVERDVTAEDDVL